ncbi:ROK family protein [Streptomyces sp. NPDC101249]|uniref:ROK family transcriptional regulator n=1 Tax=Streptomyces sp. NPDC101249 TaxID=3366140 RepID=UPI0038147275
MSMVAAGWAPLTPAERAVAIEVLLHGPISRTGIARRLGLSAGSLTRLTKPLIASGLLTETPSPAPPRAHRQGRPSLPLDIVADSHCLAGFRVTGDAVHGVVTTLRSDVLAHRSTPLTSREPDRVADQLVAMTAEFTRDFPAVAGVGVGVGGPVGEGGTGRRDVPFGALLGERTGLPVVVENDVAALVEAEAWFGAGRGLDRFVVLTVGADVGYGLVVDGVRVRSAEDGPDPGRHWIVDPGGPFTPDGEPGSAVALLSVPSIRYQVRAATGEDLGYDAILARAADGDPLTGRVVDEAARALGVLVARIANFAMPQKILLAGEGVGLVGVAGDTVRETVRAHRHPLADPVVLETRVADSADWARAAAVPAIQSLVRGGTAGGRIRSGE